MTKLKRVLCGTMCLAMAGSMLTACGDDSSSSGTADVTPQAQKKEGSADSKNTIKIYVWNQEFQGLFRRYYPEYDAEKSGYDTTKNEKTGTGDDFLKDGKKVVWVVNENKGNNYQDKLDTALKAQSDSDDKIDMFLIEADYALKYVNSQFTTPLADIGISDSDTAEMYDYTKQVATATDGSLRAVSWQATPGLFAYRRDIAKEVLGTDDPEQVQAELSDWDKFDAVAAKMAEKDYKMLSGFDDSYRVFSNNVSKPWVDGDTIQVDDMLMKWVDQTKDYTDKGYNNKTSLWDDTWGADQGPNGKVFGFFYSTWGINFTLAGNSLATAVKDGGKEEVGNGLYGQYAVCEGPAAFFWGGTWLCCAAGSDNTDTVADIMKKMTCDKAIAKQLTLDTLDYTNNKSAMQEIADDASYGSAFLGGQNHVKLFAAAAPNIKMDKTTMYDQGLNEAFQAAFKDYFLGTEGVDKDKALENFYTAAIEKYPNLKKA